MAEGYGVKVGDWALVAVIGVAGYIAYKTFSKPVADVSDIAKKTADTVLTPTGDLLQDTSKTGSAILNLVKTPAEGIANVEKKIFDKLNSALSGNSSTSSISIDPKTNAENVASFSATLAGGTYNTSTGELFDKSGKGYSVMAENVPKFVSSTTFTNAKTGSTVTRGAGSIFANKGFN